MDRRLFAVPEKTQLEMDVIEGLVALPSLDALFSTTYVDKTRLLQSIRRALQFRGQVSLEELTQAYPLEQGLAELITYLSLAADNPDAFIDDSRRVAISWVNELGATRRVHMPAVLFKCPAPVNGGGVLNDEHPGRH